MRSAACLLALGLCLPVTDAVLAQEWQSGRDLELIGRAAEARLRRDADTVLAGWQASARGIVRFTAEVDHGNGPIERVIRADELQVEVYGEAPNRSKQVITAWRDTTFQPTSIVYHRDHLGIIANDFGPTIRLGEGEEVRDVPHPLAAAALDRYQFRLGDTLVVAAPSGRVRVVRVEVRPVDSRQPGIVGALLIDVDRASLVRLDFTFTAASYRDPTVAGITVGLENALHDSERWLPSRQTIAIRRAAPLLVLPLTTVIRADWIIDDYRLGMRHAPELFRGLAIDGPRRPQSDTSWATPWPTPPDNLSRWGALHESIAAGAADRVGKEALQGLPGLRLLAQGGLSQLLHVNRVQGVSIGAGARWEVPVGVTLDLAAAFGTSDHRLTTVGAMSWSSGKLRLSVTGARDVKDMHRQPRRSGVANSLATLLDGSDAGDWYLSERFELRIDWSLSGDFRAATTWRSEQVRPVASTFTALSGDRLGNPALSSKRELVTQSTVSTFGPEGYGWELGYESVREGSARSWRRFTVRAAAALPLGLRGSVFAGAGSTRLPTHLGFVAGGAGSLPGTVPRAIGGRQLLTLELARPFEVKLAAPVGPALAGNALKSQVTPFAGFGVARQPLEGMPWPATGDIVPVVGARLDLWGPLLRLEVGWAPRTGGLSLMLDAHPDWWPLL